MTVSLDDGGGVVDISDEPVGCVGCVAEECGAFGVGCVGCMAEECGAFGVGCVTEECSTFGVGCAH